jgi:hypothetical protein
MYRPMPHATHPTLNSPITHEATYVISERQGWLFFLHHHQVCVYCGTQPQSSWNKLLQVHQKDILID